MTNEITKTTIGQLEKDALLDNAAMVQLFIQYARQWGLFTMLGEGDTKIHEYPGAIKSLAFLIDQISKEQGAAAVEAALKKINKQIITSSNDDLNLYNLKLAINEKRKEKLAADTRKATENKDAILLVSLATDQRLLDISEMDMQGKHVITKVDLDSIVDSQLPDWALAILQGELSPDEIQSILDTKADTTKVADAHADAHIAEQAAATNAGVVGTLKLE